MLTPAQILQVKTANAGPSPMQPMTPEQAKASFGASPQSQQEPTLGSRVSSDISGAGEKINQQITGQSEFAGEGAIQRGSEAAATAATSVGKVASEVLPQPIRDTGAAISNKIGEGFNFLQDKLASTKLFSDIGNLEAQGYINPKDNPEFYQLKSALATTSAIGKVSGEVAAADQVGGGLDTAAGMVKGAAKQVTKSAESTPESAAKAAADESSANAMKAHDMIDKEVRNTAEKYGDVGKALNHAEVTKGTEPIKVLASYPKGKALPSMSKLGKMNSIPAINYLRTQMKGLGKIKGDLVDTANKNITVEDLQKNIEDKINASKVPSDAMKASQKADVGKVMDSLKETYLKGISTEQLDKLKTEHANESSSYKRTGFPSRFSPDTHSLIADSARNLVEEHGGKAPIEELNKWISSHHDAITMLEKMHGKTPHGGMFTRHVGGIAGEVAGLAGGMAMGHPFLGAMAGRAGSEVVNNILSSHFISNPLKRSIIDTMKGVDPGVIQKAKDFLKENEGTAQEGKIEPTSPKAEEPTSPESIARQPEKSSPSSPEEPKGESTLSFVKNNITGPESQRGFLGFGSTKGSPKVAHIKTQINSALKEQAANSREKPPGWEARNKRIEQRIAGLRKLLQ